MLLLVFSFNLDHSPAFLWVYCFNDTDKASMVLVLLSGVKWGAAITKQQRFGGVMYTGWGQNPWASTALTQVFPYSFLYFCKFFLFRKQLGKCLQTHLKPWTASALSSFFFFFALRGQVERKRGLCGPRNPTQTQRRQHSSMSSR